jgi:four helix bundle protein
MKVKNYQELIAWQKAMDLVEEVYLASRSFPRKELYGLTSQLRRAAVSIHRMSQRGKADGQRRIFCATCPLLTDHCENLRHKY